MPRKNTELLTQSMTYEEYYEKAKDNGWIISDRDERAIKGLWDLQKKYVKESIDFSDSKSYRLAESIDSIMQRTQEQNIWYLGDRESNRHAIFSSILNERMNRDRDPQSPVTSEYLAELEENTFDAQVKQEEIDAAYKKRFHEERPLTQAEEIAKSNEELRKKREEEEARRQKELEERMEREAQEERRRRIEEMERKAMEERVRERDRQRQAEYDQKLAENRKAFDEKFHNMTNQEFADKAKKLGWRHRESQKWDDYTLLNRLYQITRNSGHPDLQELCGKILETPIDTLEKREEFLTEAQNVLWEAHYDDVIPGVDGRNLERVAKDLKPTLSEKEHLRDEKHYAEDLERDRRREEEKLEAERKKERIKEDGRQFKELLHENGWKPEDDELIDTMWETYQASIKAGKNTSKLDGDMWNMMETKLNPDSPVSDRNQMLENFQNTLRSMGYAVHSEQKKKMNNLIRAKIKESAAVVKQEQQEAWNRMDAESKENFKNIREALELDGADKSAKKTSKEAIDAQSHVTFDNVTDPTWHEERWKNMDAKTKAWFKTMNERFGDLQVKDPKTKESIEFYTNYRLDPLEEPAKISKPAPEKADLSMLEKDHARREADSLMAAVNKIDYNLLGQGSPEFTQMKEAVKELQDYAYGRGLRTQQQGTGFDIGTYYDKMAQARNAVQGYLDHKAEQFERDPARKNDSKRQKREQPRIVGSVRILEEMDKELAKAEKAMVDDAREKYRKSLEEDLKKEEALRADPNCTQRDYIKSVARTLDTYRTLNGKEWDIKPNENYADFLKRLEGNSKSTRYANDRDEELAKKSFVGICKQAKQGYKAGQRLTNEEIKAQYIASMPENAKYLEEKDMTKYSARTKIRASQENATALGGKLYSDKTNEILAKKEAEKINQPQKSANDMRRDNLKAIVEQESKRAVTDIEKSEQVVGNLGSIFEKKTIDLAREYVKQEFEREINGAGKKTYGTGIYELENEADSGELSRRFHEKVSNLLKDESFQKLAQQDPEHCVQKWTERVRKGNESRHEMMMAQDKTYQDFAKKYPKDYKERWEAAEERTERYKKVIVDSTQSKELANSIAFGDDPAAFNKKDPHYQGAREEFLNVLANVALQELVKESIEKNNLYSKEFALHPEKLIDIKKDIVEGMKKDPVFEIKAYVQDKLENPGKLKEKAREFALEGQKKRLAKKGVSVETRKEEVKKETTKKEVNVGGPKI